MVLLTILSFGIYWPIWFGQTWSELKQVVRDPGMNPVGHALSQFVPIYGFFRAHAHFRTINEQSAVRALPLGMRTGTATAVLVVGSFLSGIGVGVIVVAYVLANGQRSLNRILERDFGLGSKRNASTGEWISIAALLLLVAAIGISLMASSLNTSRVPAVSENCQGWQDLAADLAPISASTNAFFEDLDSTMSPDDRDAERWATTASRIREQYEALDYPPAFGRYVRLSILTMRDYQQGFSAMALGNYDNGQTLLERGDTTLPQGEAAFRSANAECAT